MATGKPGLLLYGYFNLQINQVIRRNWNWFLGHCTHIRRHRPNILKILGNIAHRKCLRSIKAQRGHAFRINEFTALNFMQNITNRSSLCEEQKCLWAKQAWEQCHYSWLGKFVLDESIGAAEEKIVPPALWTPVEHFHWIHLIKYIKKKITVALSRLGRFGLAWTEITLLSKNKPDIVVAMLQTEQQGNSLSPIMFGLFERRVCVFTICKNAIHRHAIHAIEIKALQQFCGGWGMLWCPQIMKLK